jgi:hypothetical protein
MARLVQIGPRIAPFAKEYLARLERELPLNVGVRARKEVIVGALIHSAEPDERLKEAVERYEMDLAKWEAREARKTKGRKT